MSKKIYLAASTQKENVGVGQYGTEQDRMMIIADRVKQHLESQDGKFVVYRNEPNWTLSQTVKHANSLNCDLFIDNHTNAGPAGADGTEVYYHGSSIMGRILASKLNNRIAPISPGSDRGVLSDTTIYLSGFYVLRATRPPAALIEYIYHTNMSEVVHFLANIDMYAKATAMGICDFFNEPWIEPKSEVELLVDDMIKAGLVTSTEYWINVLNGVEPAKPEYLQVVFKRAVSK